MQRFGIELMWGLVEVLVEWANGRTRVGRERGAEGGTHVNENGKCGVWSDRV